MKSKLSEKQKKALAEEYLKGTRIELIMGFFGITRGGLYYILRDLNIHPNRKILDKKDKVC